MAAEAGNASVVPSRYCYVIHLISMAFYTVVVGRNNLCLGKSRAWRNENRHYPCYQGHHDYQPTAASRIHLFFVQHDTRGSLPLPPGDIFIAAQEIRNHAATELTELCHTFRKQSTTENRAGRMRSLPFLAEPLYNRTGKKICGLRRPTKLFFPYVILSDMIHIP